MSEAEETLTAETVRRQLVLDKRRETRRRELQEAERHESLKAAGRLVDVEVTGTFEASARCLFLFDRARMTGGVSLSSDLGTAACTGSGNRGMVLGSRGFRGGLHYWEVGSVFSSVGVPEGLVVAGLPGFVGTINVVYPAAESFCHVVGG